MNYAIHAASWLIVCVGIICTGLLTICVFLALSDWLLRQTREWFVIVAAIKRRIGDKAYTRRALEYWSDPDSRFERERDKLRDELRAYHDAANDIRSVAEELVTKSNTDTDAFVWESHTEGIDAIKLSELIQQARTQLESEAIHENH